jgi:hypothetical protein
METIRYYKLVGRDVVPCKDVLEWASWFETQDRFLCQEDAGAFYVSTVCVGLNHNFMGGGPPLVFETMVFSRFGPKGHDFDCVRTSTMEEAEAAHAALVEVYSSIGAWRVLARYWWREFRDGFCESFGKTFSRWWS